MFVILSEEVAAAAESKDPYGSNNLSSRARSPRRPSRGTCFLCRPYGTPFRFYALPRASALG